MKNNLMNYTKKELVDMIDSLNYTIRLYDQLYSYSVNLNENIINNFPEVETWIDNYITLHGSNLDLITGLITKEE